jgi:hypothetical protein
MNEILSKLELTGEYIFHGSPQLNLEILEPKQSIHDSKTDGIPAVSGTPYLKLAIFRALINSTNIGIDYESSFGIDKGKVEMFISSQDALNEVKNKKGCIYIFLKKDFEPYDREGRLNPNAMEWRSYKSVKPVDAIKVSYEDLSINDINIQK